MGIRLPYRWDLTQRNGPVIALKDYFMNEQLSLQRTDKKLVRHITVTVVASAAIWVVYECFAKMIIKAMYYGKSLDVLNNLIKYQYKKSVEVYYDVADGFFYDAWLLFGVVYPLVLIAGVWLSRYKANLQAATGGCSDLQADPGFGLKHSKRDMLIVFFTSLIVRALTLPFVVDLQTAGDETYYWSVPKLLASGKIASAVMRPPLWGYLLAIPTAIYDHPIAGRTLNVLIAALAPLLIYMLAARVFDRRTGLIAGLMYAFFPTHIGFSHSLWSETLFGVLLLLSVYLYVCYTQNTQRTGYLLLCSVVAGLALLTKEFAVIAFGAIMVGVFFLKIPRKIKKISICCLLFLAPTMIYSVAVSCVTRRVIVLNDAIILNFYLATRADLDYKYSFETREDTVSKLVTFLKERNLSETLEGMKHQFGRLWAPRSYISTRVLSYNVKEGWNYGLARPWPYAYLILGSYLFVVATGLVGICLADSNQFKIFSVTCLILLSSIGIAARVVTRYRAPFMFIFVIYSAYMLSHAITLIANPSNTRRMPVLLVLLRVFVKVVGYRVPTFGRWG